MHPPSPATQCADAAPVDAASVLLLRDGPRGLEVLLARRDAGAAFAAGAYVFPGGKVAPEDRAAPPGRLDPFPANQVAAAMGCTEELAVALHVAAVRETVEEVGILLGRSQNRPGQRGLATGAIKRVRALLLDRERCAQWWDALGEEGIVLRPGALRWWAWWVTPEGVARRFDTRFFAARAPEGQAPSVTLQEMTDVVWRRPQDALDDAAAGVAHMVLPTRRNLERLAAHRDVDAALAAAAAEPVARTQLEPAGRRDGRPLFRDPATGRVEEA